RCAVRVEAAKKEELEWIVARTDCVLTPIAGAIKAVDTAGRIRGMVAYDWWTDNSVQVHMAVDTPIAWRDLIRWGFWYPFEQRGRDIIIGVVAASNEKSLRMSKHLGFVETYRIRDGHRRGVDLVLLEMRKEN